LPGGLDRERAPRRAAGRRRPAGGPCPGGDDSAGTTPLRPAAAPPRLLNRLWGDLMVAIWRVHDHKVTHTGRPDGAAAIHPHRSSQTVRMVGTDTICPGRYLR